MMKTIKLSSFQNGFLFLLALGFSLHWAPYLHAGVLYSDQELWASGDLWKKTEAQWHVEKARHEAALKKISASKLSRAETDFRIRQEFAFHKAQIQSLSRKRYDVQAVLIRESNARASGGKYRAPAPIKATQGTGGKFDPKITQATFKQMQETLKDMGLNDTLPFKDGKLVSGATGTAIGFDLSMGANGWEPKVGSPLFKELIKSEANHPDAQLSKSMQNEASGTKDLGADYVAVLDYQKQALEVMKASSMEHSKDTNIAEKLAIAIYKAAEYLPQIDPSEKVPEEDRKAGYGLGDTNEVVNGDFTKGYNQQKLQKKLHDIASGKTKVKTPQDVEKLKKLGEAVFKAAERKTFRDARKKIATKRAEIKKLAKMQKRLDALADTPGNRAKKAKLKKSFIAKKAALRKGIAKMNASNNAVASKKSPYTHTRSQAVVKKGGVSRSAPKARVKQRMSPGKALNTANKILVIADIGNACKKLEDYREGKASLGDVVRGVVNLTPAGPIVNIYDKTKSTGTDFGDAYKNLTRANEQNLTAHLNQWEIQFRNAGMSPKDARSYVADAVLSGNLDILESKADELRNQGKVIKSPKIVVEDCLPGPDGGYGYMWENTKDMAVGIAKGAYEGTVYIVTSPHRAVGAWHEGVLKEATLDYNSKTATSDMKTRLFRKLLDVGIDRNRALAAVNGSESMLKEVTREAQKKMKVIREEQAAIQAERDAFDQKLKSCMREISRLRFADTSIKTTPSSPLKVPANSTNDDVFPVEVSLSGSFTDRVGEIARMLEALTGKAPKVSYTYTCLIKSAKELSPSSWEVEVPGKPGNYPVKIHVRVSITSFTGIYKPIHRVIDRTIKGVISVKPSTESIRFTKKNYSLESEYPKDLHVKVSDQAPQGRYFYDWQVGDEHFTTTDPKLTFTPHLKKTDCPSSIIATVLLCDRDSGCVLDEAKAELHIVYPDKPPLDTWTVLKKTTEVCVSIKHLYSFPAKLGAAPVISYQYKTKRRVPDWNELFEDVTDVHIQMANDGKSIIQVEFEISSYWLGPIDPSKLSRFTGADPSQKVARQLFSGARYKLKNLKLVQLNDETPTKSASATYRIRGKAQDCTFQEAGVEDGQLVWKKIRPLGHLTSLAYVHFSMSSKTMQEKGKKAAEIRQQNKEAKEKVIAKTKGGLVYKGPFATETPLKATITINVGKDHRSVSGSFVGEGIIKKEKSKATIEGSFLGTLNEDGTFEATISSGSITPWVKTNGSWYPRVLDAKKIPSTAKLIGKLKGDTITGDMLANKKHAFKWSASLQN